MQLPASPKNLLSRLGPSQAALAAMAVGIALLALFLANWLGYRNEPQRVAWSDYMQWPQYLALSLLWLVICAMTYWFVRLWHEELPTDNATIEKAWQAGISSLRSRGQQLQQSPLYLVLGVPDRQHQQDLLEQSGLQLLEPLIPAEPDAPIHWAFTAQGIWLFVREAGSYNKVASCLSIRKADSDLPFGMTFLPGTTTSVAQVPSELTQADETNSTTIATNTQPTHLASANHSGTTSFLSRSGQTDSSIGNTSSAHTVTNLAERVGQTLEYPNSTGPRSSDVQVAVLDSTAPAMPAPELTTSGGINCLPVSATTETTSEAVDSTLSQLEELLDSASQAESAAIRPQTGPNPSAEAQSGWQTELAFQATIRPATLTSAEVTYQQHTLREICRRIRNGRQATAPANGVVVIVPSEQLLSGPVQASELGLALRSDLQLVQQAWQLQTPATVIVDGMQSLPGTKELVRRGGPEAARSEGAGAGYPIRYQPEAALLHHHCKLAVSQIEARIYRQLSANDALSQVGNHSLFQLLITCRSRLLPAVKTFLSEAMGLEYPSPSAHEPSLFAGLHFMASGTKATEQAWVHAALSQVISNQNFLRWTEERQQADRRHKWMVSLLKTLCVALAVTLLACLWLAG